SDLAVVGADDTKFGTEGIAITQRLLDLLVEPQAIFGMDLRQPLLRADRSLSRGQPELFEEASRTNHLSVRAGFEFRQFGGFLHQPEPLLAAAQGLLGHLSLVDVLGDDDRAGWPTFRRLGER